MTVTAMAFASSNAATTLMMAVMRLCLCIATNWADWSEEGGFAVHRIRMGGRASGTISSGASSAEMAIIEVFNIAGAELQMPAGLRAVSFRVYAEDGVASSKVESRFVLGPHILDLSAPNSTSLRLFYAHALPTNSNTRTGASNTHTNARLAADGPLLERLRLDRRFRVIFHRNDDVVRASIDHNDELVDKPELATKCVACCWLLAL